MIIFATSDNVLKLPRQRVIIGPSSSYIVCSDNAIPCDSGLTNLQKPLIARTGKKDFILYIKRCILAKTKPKPMVFPLL